MAVVLLWLPAGAEAARQSVTATVSTKRPATTTGSTLAIDWRDPANPAGKPYSVKTIVTDFPPGTAIDTGAIPQCKASDAELMARGAAACPAGSLISRGTLLTDTGSSGVFPPRFGKNTVANFNNAGEQIGIAESTDPPTRVVTRSKLSGNRLTFEAPLLPGNPPPDPYLAFRELRLSGPPLPYARTPPSCPRSRNWATTFTFTYRDGATERVQTRSPCIRDLRAPRVRIRGGPLKRCAVHDFTARVRIGERSPLRRAALYVDGRFKLDTRRKTFRRRVQVNRLRSGRHRLTVIARDSSGNRGRTTLHFRRCR
jgi:hypothetical protein